MTLSQMLGCVVHTLRKLATHFDRAYCLGKFASAGRGVKLCEGGQFTYRTITLGDDVFIGRGCTFLSEHGRIEIGDHVMFGPGVTIIGGNHDIRRTGRPMKAAGKAPGSDGVVRIGSDVWIGASAVILPRVMIGEGAVVGAGTVVTKDVPPYAIVVGNPARVLRYRE